MLKELFDKGKCALGFHAGEWRYVSESGCEQIQICSRCNNQSHQVVHHWQAWQYDVSGACEMTRRCERCKDQETKTEHVWGEPVYEAAESCVQIRPCSRCGETATAATVHNWNSWSYEAQGQDSARKYRPVHAAVLREIDDEPAMTGANGRRASFMRRQFRSAAAAVRWFSIWINPARNQFRCKW
jgi:hypothetical protein